MRAAGNQPYTFVGLATFVKSRTAGRVGEHPRSTERYTVVEADFRTGTGSIFGTPFCQQKYLQHPRLVLERQIHLARGAVLFLTPWGTVKNKTLT